jgi:hypothetical protein
VVGDPGVVRSVAALDAVGQVAQVEGEDAARPQRPGRDQQRPVDGRLVGQVAEDVAHRDHGVGRRDRVVGQDQHPRVLGARGVPAGQGDHGGRGVGGDHPVPGVDQVPRQQPAPSSQLHHQATPFAHRRQQPDDAGGAPIGVEPEPPMVDLGQIGPEVVAHQPI